MQLVIALLAVSIIVSCKGRQGSDATAVFGQDDRVESHTINDPATRRSIASSVMLVKRTNLTRVGDQVQIKSVPLYSKSVPVTAGFGTEEEKVPLCREGVNFSEQPSAGFCSGAFLQIEGSQGIGTAGHCVLTSFDCEKTSVIFDYALGENGVAPQSVPAENVYDCQRVVTAQDAKTAGGFVDYAFFTLDREVVKREPLQLSRDTPKVGQAVYVVGHPLGVPQKFAPGQVREVSPLAFGADFDGLNGNSGSPVFDTSTHRIFGFWANGPSLSFTKTGDCATIRACDESCLGWNMTNHLATLGDKPLTSASTARPILLQASLTKDGRVVRTTTDRDGFRGPTLAAGQYDLTLTWQDIQASTTIRAQMLNSSGIVIEGQSSELKPSELATTLHTVKLNPSACPFINGQLQSPAQVRLTVTVGSSSRDLIFFLPCPPNKDLAGLTLESQAESALAAGQSEMLQTNHPACQSGKPCACFVEYRKLWWGETWRREYPVKWSSPNGKIHFCDGLPRKYKDAKDYFFWVAEQGVGRYAGY